MSYRLSLLEKSLIPQGSTAAEALRRTTQLAQRAEALGYHRFWVNEHHGNDELAGSTPEVLAGLRPIIKKDGVVTAGNSSSLNDGASAILVVSERAAQKYGLTPRARVVDSTSAGLAPEIMGLGPVPATEKALERSGWSVADLGAVELNEAFATQSLASMRRLGLDPETVNADGGAIALGHPLGSSGSRLVVTLLGRMEREGADRGLATMCVGVGQGAAMLVERV